MDATVAVYEDWGIGAEGTQPFVLPEDRKHFRGLTAGAAVIVGRKTLLDFPGGQPLKGRINIVLTTRDIEVPGAVVVHGVAEALAEAKKHDKVFVIGGASVYKEMLPHISRVFVTKINARPHSDSFFPNLDEAADWTCIDDSGPLDSGGTAYRFCTYERPRNA